MSEEIRALDVAALERAVNDASSSASVLWLSFLSLVAYLAITVGSVTHSLLFFDAPIKLPLLGVELPIAAFFAIAPVLFVIFHFYLFLQLVLLSRKVGSYDLALQHSLATEADRELLRRRLNGFIVVQILAGPVSERRGGISRLLLFIAWTTLIVAPILLLLLILLVFLPYQDSSITWLQRIAILLDFSVVWFLWPSIISPAKDIGRTRMKCSSLSELSAMGITVFVAIFSVLVATVSGEFVDGNIVILGVDRIVSVTFRNPDVSLSKALFDGQISAVTGRRSSLWSRTLVLPGANLVDPEQLKRINERIQQNPNLLQWEHTLSLRGRNLRGAVLDRADLRRVDLTGAHLEGASLQQAELEGARLDFARLDHANLEFARLGDASLKSAYLRGALTRTTYFQGADLAGAQLQGAKLFFLQGAILAGARLDGADLTRAQLIGADLQGAHFEGADMSFAALQGSNIISAFLEGADLRGAHLCGFR